MTATLPRLETLLTPEIPIPRKIGRRSRVRARRRVALRTVAIGVTTLAFLVGIGITATTFVAPAVVERGIGTVRAATNAVAVELAPAPIEGGEKLPNVTLGVLGPNEALDACDGTFPQLASYAVDAELQPVYAAHNGCGGDIILPLEVGSRIVIEDAAGVSVAYHVVDLRDVDKHTATTADVVGMEGSLLLQTCHWGDPIMRFVGLERSV